jgi:hypothetical protein
MEVHGMKIRTVVVPVILIVLLGWSAGCGQPNAPETTATPAATTTLPAIVGYLPSDFISSLGTGVNDDFLLAELNLAPGALPAGLYRYGVADRPGVVCEIELADFHESTLVIRSAVLVEGAKRTTLFEPVPDQAGLADFQIVINGKGLGLGPLTESALLDWNGPPLSTETIRMTDETRGEHWVKTLAYDGQLIRCIQLDGAADKNTWYVMLITSSSPATATPRGLRVGLGYREVIRLLGTGDFLLTPDAWLAPSIIRVEKWSGDGETGQMDLTFEKGLLKTIQIDALEP